MAEREGVEPPVRSPPRRFSKPVQSTTLPSLREVKLVVSRPITFQQKRKFVNFIRTLQKSR